jgi:hypothetical protein
MTGRPALSVCFLRRSVNSPSRTSRFCSARSGLLVFPAMFHTVPRLWNAARRNSAVGRSQTLWSSHRAEGPLDQAATGSLRRSPGGLADTPRDPRQSDRSIHPERSGRFRAWSPEADLPTSPPYPSHQTRKRTGAPQVGSGGRGRVSSRPRSRAADNIDPPGAWRSSSCRRRYRSQSSKRAAALSSTLRCLLSVSLKPRILAMSHQRDF